MGNVNNGLKFATAFTAVLGWTGGASAQPVASATPDAQTQNSETAITGPFAATNTDNQYGGKTFFYDVRSSEKGVRAESADGTAVVLAAECKGNKVYVSYGVGVGNEAIKKLPAPKYINYAAVREYCSRKGQYVLKDPLIRDAERALGEVLAEQKQAKKPQAGTTPSYQGAHL